MRTVEGQYLSIDDVARRLGVSGITVRRWVKSGKLVGRKAGAQWRFDPDTVDTALDSGLLEGASRTEPQAVHDPILDTWREYVQCRLERSSPKHVVVNDRRGAKMWNILGPGHYRWGVDLWHSTAIEMMTSAQIRRLFGKTRVLLFDEMMRHGRDMHRLRIRLENLKAEVTSLVCIRSRSHAEAATLLEYESDACEDLSDREFNERATFISKLVHLADPPLDVDHLVIRALLKQDFSLDEMLVSMMRWGMAFPVWDEVSGSGTCAVTLDRPQFFDTANSPPGERGFKVNWSGAGKIRFYIEPTARSGHCSFVTYPEISGSEKLWQGYLRDEFGEEIAGPPTESEEGQCALRRAYRLSCMYLSIGLLRDFVSSGAAGDLGLSLGEPDGSQLRAIYGPTLGNRLTRLVKTALGDARKTSIPPIAASPPPLLLRTTQRPASYDAFACRTEMLRNIERRTNSDEAVPALPYRDLFKRLAPYAESTVSRVLDSELDIGTISPHIVWDIVETRGCPEEVRLKRGYCRGEYKDGNEWQQRNPLPHSVAPIGRMLLLGPFVVAHFLAVTGKEKMTVRDFDEVFVNLGHDLKVREDGHIDLTWRPCRSGAVPIMSSASVAGQSMRLDRFLLDPLPPMLIRTKSEGGPGWLYSPGLAWSEELLDGSGCLQADLVAQVASLVWFYGEIQRRLPDSDILSTLASVRTPRVAYTSGWYHFDSWRTEGLRLLAHMGIVAHSSRDARSGLPLASHLKRWAESARLLRQKLDAFRRLPELKTQIGMAFPDRVDFGPRRQVLTGVDPTGATSAAEFALLHALAELDLAQKLMRVFTSFVIQVATACGVDCGEVLSAEQADGSSAPKDATHLQAELLTLRPNLRGDCDGPLRECTEEARGGILTPAIAERLGRVLETILRLLLDMIRPPQESIAAQMDRSEAESGRRECYRKLLPMDGAQCAIAVVDLSPLAALAEDEVEKDRPKPLRELLDEATTKASQTAQRGLTLEQVDLDIIAFRHATPWILVQAIESFLAHVIETQRVFLRAGVALYRSDLTVREDPERAYSGIAPGSIAFELARYSATAADAIVITQAVFSGISGDAHEDFKKVPDVGTPQGSIHWRAVRRSRADLHSQQ